MSATKEVSLFDMPGTILLTGADGFTGRHFTATAEEGGYQVIPLQSDITDSRQLNAEVCALEFDYVVHLAAISAVNHDDFEALYRVNLFGTLNLLAAVASSGQSPERVLIASSANVYGDSPVSPISEDACPNPVNHYAMSKLAMEQMAKAHAKDLALIFSRPFNYTGVGHDDRFVIPKLIEHFANRSPTVELGNLQVKREFNDVRTVCRAYVGLLECGKPGETYNICSGRIHSLSSIIGLLSEITGHAIEVRVNPRFVRQNEVASLSGDPGKLRACIDELNYPPLRGTLEWMLGAYE